jgi:5-methyltetrahydrofolate--homocysteine methyltransferase
MNKFLERINAGEILVADGATGTEPAKDGLKPGRPPEDLIMDDPDTILKLASSFVEAGADIILTCTFGGTRMRMKDSKYQDRDAGSEHPRRRDRPPSRFGRASVLVAGSMGPVPAP